MATDREASIVLTDRSERSRYELTVDGELAGWVGYSDEDLVRALTHSEVDPGRRGQGIGGKLVAGVLDDVRRRGMKVVPKCPFVRSYLQRHRDEYDDLLAPGQSLDGDG